MNLQSLGHNRLLLPRHLYPPTTHGIQQMWTPILWCSQHCMLYTYYLCSSLPAPVIPSTSSAVNLCSGYVITIIPETWICVSTCRDKVTISKRGNIVGRGLFLKYNHDGNVIVHVIFITIPKLIIPDPDDEFAEVLLKSISTSEDLELPLVTSSGACTFTDLKVRLACMHAVCLASVCM